MWNYINQKILQGSKVYVVCANIDDSDDDHYQGLSVNSMYKYLCSKFNKDIVLMAHGKLSSDEENNVLNKFKSDKYKILVSTTIVEVGVDVKEADIIVLGTGQPDFVDINSFTAGQIVVDVSINFNSEGKMCGDIKKSDYQALADQCVSFTPVPGGVGQLTVLALIEQTIEIAKKRIGGAYESK
jgi:5,10-methylene-tetrahydrofolate dehydrogenase/methenyl tetrahydrofolate cyclohydrolase